MAGSVIRMQVWGAIVALGAPAAASSPGRVEACGPVEQQGWLCSTVYDLTHNVGLAQGFDRVEDLVRILVIVLVAYLLVRLSRLVVRRVTARIEGEAAIDALGRFRRRTGLSLLDTGPVPTIRRQQRARTMGSVLRSIVALIIWFTAFVMILDSLDVNFGPLLASAGVLGVALGFGAQSLVRDFLAGFFMLVEDQFGVGDVIDAGFASGTVEGVSLRTTRLRDVQGVVWHIPNGEIHRVANMSQQWSRALLDVPVAYDTDIDTAIEVIERSAGEVTRDERFSGAVLSEPEVWGVESLDADRVVIRLVVKTRPLEQWRVARELRARIKAAFDEAGIEVPWPRPAYPAAGAPRPGRPTGGPPGTASGAGSGGSSSSGGETGDR